MNILLHTIALEPARWTPQRVSQKLEDLIPLIAGPIFKSIEVFEPHLVVSDENKIHELLARHGLTMGVLSSYLQVAPLLSDDNKFVHEMNELVARVKRFKFPKVRLFPGGGVSSKDTAAVNVVAQRISQIAGLLPDVQILLETHDGSIADEPEAMPLLMEKIGCSNVGLLWQPTVFQPEFALKQFAVQKDFIRHVHLQNRNPDVSFSTLKDGIIPWQEILPHLNVDVSIEFVRSGICSVDQFDLGISLAEAITEADYVRSIL